MSVYAEYTVLYKWRTGARPSVDIVGGRDLIQGEFMCIFSSFRYVIKCGTSCWEFMGEITHSNSDLIAEIYPVSQVENVCFLLNWPKISVLVNDAGSPYGMVDKVGSNGFYTFKLFHEGFIVELVRIN